MTQYKHHSNSNMSRLASLHHKFDRNPCGIVACHIYVIMAEIIRGEKCVFALSLMKAYAYAEIKKSSHVFL